ncbi:MAG TPA: glycosyltransferase family A protein [Alphaproteobacteria bacterium]|nr:glycosyltransferase family A protein [Alphaproteobacteria bacterium]
MANHPSLAVVIPAYKSSFLREVLASIASQTCRNFHVYVGDDASPENIRDITREFSDKLPIYYHRFSKNLGAISLAEHWRRCINLSHEPWVWLFSDDDLMEDRCVETFYRELRSTSARYELYRFNTYSIDGQGRLISENASHPQNETGPDFLVSRLRGGRTSTAQELIFSRAAWESVGGFPDFPLGWASDDAFIATLGARKPIRVIPGPRLKWRLSGKNISTDNSLAMAIQKHQACRKFVEWAADFLRRNLPTEGALTNGELAALLEDWFFMQMIYRRQLMSVKSSLDVDELAVSVWRRPRGYGFLKTMKFNWNLAREKVLNR